MLKIRNVLILMGMLLSPAASADVQVSIGIGLPHVSIGINVPAYPQLVVVPGYPVYYAPQLRANFFFYDGMYWVYQNDYWYTSAWYNGPWWIVGPEVVPVYVLRIPVRYYRHPPSYFRAWRADAPPRWGDHWGRDWQQHRSGWDRWDRRSAPAPAPAPVYQRQYTGERYPSQVEQQYELHQQNYRYQPREPVVRKHYEERAAQRAPARQEQPRQERQGAPGERDSRQQEMQRSSPRQPEGGNVPRTESPQRGGADTQRSSPAPAPQARPEAQERRQPAEREQPMPGAQERVPSQQGRDGRDAPKQAPGQGADDAQWQRQGQDQRQGQGQGQRQDQGPRDDQGQRKGQGQDREQEPERGGWDRNQ